MADVARRRPTRAGQRCSVRLDHRHPSDRSCATSRPLLCIAYHFVDATAVLMLGDCALRRSAAAAAASAYADGSSASIEQRRAARRRSALRRPQRNAARADAATSRLLLQGTAFHSYMTAEDDHKLICHAILFSRTHTVLTLVRSTTRRRRHDRTGSIDASNGICSPWRWLYSYRWLCARL